MLLSCLVDACSKKMQQRTLTVHLEFKVLLYATDLIDVLAAQALRKTNLLAYWYLGLRNYIVTVLGEAALFYLVQDKVTGLRVLWLKTRHLALS